jgi:hypothetical protein
MNYTISLFGFYACLAAQGSGSPLFDHAMTIEREGLKREGRGYFIRLPFTGNHPTTGLVIGRWRKK